MVIKSHKKRTARDKGYVIAFVAILLLPILGFTSFSVDLGAWYAKAAELQQAADAAALAGAAFLPDVNRAEERAKEVAAINGFAENPPAVTINVQVPPSDPKTISVSITLDKFPRYFSQVFSNNDLALTRTSQAEYLPAPKMGSPRNFLGTGFCYNGASGTNAQAAGTVTNGPFSTGTTTCSAPSRENWWLAVNYACTPRESADRFASYIDGTAQNVTGGPGTTTRGACQTTSRQTFSGRTAYFAENPEYNSDGYYYGITVKAPPSAARSYVLEGFSMGQGSRDPNNGSLCVNGPDILESTTPEFRAIETSGTVAEDAAFTINWRLYDNNAFDPRVTPITSSNVEVKPSNCGNFSGWYSFNGLTLTAEAGQTKTYWLQVQPKPYEELTAGGATPSVVSGRGVNVFSLRVRNASSVEFSACSSLVGDVIPYNEYCPEIYGVENLPTLTSFDLSPGAPSERSFFLAQLPDEYINRTASIEVFDPDPFVSSINIVNEGAPSAQRLQQFTPRILCRTGKLAVNEVCEPYNQRTSGSLTTPVQENKPSSLDAGRFISYNNMSETNAFLTFRGPAPLPSDVACVAGPTSCLTWFNSASNTPYNSGEDDLWGLSARTLRMSFTVPEVDATDSNNWWKINFGVNKNISSLPTDRMTWTLKVSGEPVRLLPNQIPYGLVPGTP
jgi:hypothetical protein